MNTEKLYEQVSKVLKNEYAAMELEAGAEPEAEAEFELEAELKFRRDPLFQSRVRTTTSKIVQVVLEQGR